MLSEYQIGMLKSQYLNEVKELHDKIGEKLKEIDVLKQTIKERQAKIDALNDVLEIHV